MVLREALGGMLWSKQFAASLANHAVAGVTRVIVGTRGRNQRGPLFVESHVEARGSCGFAVGAYRMRRWWHGRESEPNAFRAREPDSGCFPQPVA